MLRALVTIGGMQLAAMIALMLRTKGLALILGPGDIGVMAVIDKLIAMVSQTASLSMPFAALRFLPSLRQTPVAFQHLRRSMALTVLTASVLAALGAAAVTFVWPGAWGSELASHRAWLVAALMTTPIVATAAFLPGVLAGGLDHRGAMTFTVTHAVVLSGSGLLGAWLGGVRGVYVAYGVAGGMLVAWRLLPISKRVATGSGGPLGLNPEVWRFALSLLALAWIVPYAALYTHFQILRHFGPDISGYMQAAMGVAVALRTVLGSGHQFFLTPHVNRTSPAAARMQWAVRYQRTLALLVGLVTPPLLLGADVAVRLLYSRAFLPAAPHVWLFVIAEVLTLFAGTYQSLILAFGFLRYHVVQNLAAQAVTIAIAFVLVPHYGIAAAALAPAGGQIVIWVGTLMFLRRHLDVRVPRHTALLTAATIAIIAIAGLVGARLPWTTAGIAARGLAWAGGLALLATFSTKEERGKVAAVVRMGPRGWSDKVRSFRAK